MNIEKAIDIYLDWKATHASFAPSRYIPRLRGFADFVGPERPLIEITGDDVVRYHQSLEAKGFMFGHNKKKYSKATIAYSSRIFKNFFMFWHGRRESNVNHKEIIPIRYIVPIKRTVSEDEFFKMRESLDERFFEGLQRKLAICLLWDTGMRVSELCDLKLSDIHDRHPTHGIKTATIRTRKTMRYNLVAWTQNTDELLIQYLAIRKNIVAPTDALLIPSKREATKAITVKTIQRWVTEISHKVGLGEGITPHSFRHGKGHAILNTPGSNIRDVAAILRHSRPESAYHYLSLNEDYYLRMVSQYLKGGDKEILKTS
jgi:site-specific recombinase XerD